MPVFGSKEGVMQGYRHGLADSQWKLLKPLMEQVGGTNGRKPADNRRWVDALFWMSKAGLPWRDLPPAFGKWRSVHDRFVDWAKSGRWERLFGLLAGFPDMLEAFVDSTVFKAAPCAAGALKKSKALLRAARASSLGKAAAA